VSEYVGFGLAGIALHLRRIDMRAHEYVGFDVATTSDYSARVIATIGPNGVTYMSMKEYAICVIKSQPFF